MHRSGVMTKPPGSEVGRDEKRDDPNPKQHGRDWNEPANDEHRPPPNDEGGQRETKVTREKYETPRTDNQ